MSDQSNDIPIKVNRHQKSKRKWTHASAEDVSWNGRKTEGENEGDQLQNAFLSSLVRMECTNRSNYINKFANSKNFFIPGIKERKCKWLSFKYFFNNFQQVVK